MKKVGRKTTLNNDVITKIKALILEGHNIRETAKIALIPENTLYTWIQENYMNMAVIVKQAQLDRKLNKAERNIDEILDIKGKDRETLRVKADMTKFVAQTLGKKDYSIRTELTGADGKDLTINIDSDIAKKNKLD